jgi:hypothetical protein
VLAHYSMLHAAQLHLHTGTHTLDDMSPVRPGHSMCSHFEWCNSCLREAIAEASRSKFLYSLACVVRVEVEVARTLDDMSPVRPGHSICSHYPCTSKYFLLRLLLMYQNITTSSFMLTLLLKLYLGGHVAGEAGPLDLLAAALGPLWVGLQGVLGLVRGGHAATSSENINREQRSNE